MLITPNILQTFKPESEEVNLSNPLLAQRPRVASLLDSKQPAFNKASSDKKSEIKLEAQMIKLNNPLFSKITSNPESKNNLLFSEEKKVP